VFAGERDAGRIFRADAGHPAEMALLGPWEMSGLVRKGAVNNFIRSSRAGRVVNETLPAIFKPPSYVLHHEEKQS